MSRFLRNTLILAGVSLFAVVVPTLLTATGIMDAYMAGTGASAGEQTAADPAVMQQ